MHGSYAVALLESDENLSGVFRRSVLALAEYASLGGKPHNHA